MIKKFSVVSLAALMLSMLYGCDSIGDKTATLSVVYIATTVLSLILLVGYCLLIKKREPWFLLLFSAVAIVNIGYLSLSLSNTLNEALLSNRIAYFGSVFLPVSMLMTILKTCKITIPRWAVGVILAISVVVFLIAASPGYLDIYYKEVTIIKVGGATALDKVYGPLHSVYLYYLLGHFGSMIGVIIYSCIKKKVKSRVHAVLLLFSVFVNIAVWLMEQLVKIDFEVLSVSYIASELFLLGINWLMQDMSFKALATVSDTSQSKAELLSLAQKPDSTPDTTQEKSLSEKAQFLKSRLYSLTPTEREIFTLYLNNTGTKDVMKTLSITENTLKYHNKNIYSKLGVANRKELVAAARSAGISPAIS